MSISTGAFKDYSLRKSLPVCVLGSRLARYYTLYPRSFSSILLAKTLSIPEHCYVLNSNLSLRVCCKGLMLSNERDKRGFAADNQLWVGGCVCVHACVCVCESVGVHVI